MQKRHGGEGMGRRHLQVVLALHCLGLDVLVDLATEQVLITVDTPILRTGVPGRGGEKDRCRMRGCLRNTACNTMPCRKVGGRGGAGWEEAGAEGK